MPQLEGVPEHEGADSLPPAVEATTENFFASLDEPQCGHFVPSQLLERTITSLSFRHFSQ